MNHLISCKQHGQIYVTHENNIDDVKTYIKELAGPWLNIYSLVAYCRSRGIDCRIYHNGNNPTPPLRVELAAIKSIVDESVWSIPKPGRHHDVIRLMVEKGYPTPIKGVQGFILNDGTFVGRNEAMEVAHNAEQLLDRCDRDYYQLFSEDVWEGRLDWNAYNA